MFMLDCEEAEDDQLTIFSKQSVDLHARFAETAGRSCQAERNVLCPWGPEE